MNKRFVGTCFAAAALPLLFATCGDSTEPELAAALVSVSTGSLHTCGLTASGEAFCWGWNRDGQIGNGSTDDDGVKVPLAVSEGMTFSDISAGGGHTCGITTAGQAYCWGLNLNGQLGTGTLDNATVPMAVAGGLSFTEIRAGGVYSCALTAAGEGYCWGWNGEGQLGDGTQTDRTTPVAVVGGLTFDQIDAGAFHTCGVAPDGRGYCWGRNDDGQLGDGTNDQALQPVQVTGGLTFAAIEAGFSHSCGVTTGNDVYCWGDDNFGQVGDGMGGGGLEPTQIVDGSGYTSITAGAAYSCGFQANGDALCWGLNQNGQLGSDVAEPCFDTEGNLFACSSTPAPVSGALQFSLLSANTQHTCGVSVSGGAWCWGLGTRGQLGDGSSGDNNLSIEPVRVLGQP